MQVKPPATTALICLVLISAAGGCVKGPTSANALLGKTVGECNSIFGTYGLVRFTILPKTSRSNYTGRVTLLSEVDDNDLLWTGSEADLYCEVADGVVVDCFEESIHGGTRKLKDSKTELKMATSDRISELDDFTIVALPIYSVSGFDKAKSTNLPNHKEFSGVITYRASYSRYFYTVAFKNGTADDVMVTDIGEYGETAE